MSTADVPVTASRLSAWLDRLGDRSNPLLLRLVRQELRNRTFLVVFNLLLLVSAGVSMLVAAGAEAESRVGMKLLAVLCGALAFALWVVQPLGTYHAMVREREESTWDLVELSGLRPGRILRGVLWSGAVQGALYVSAIAPFMVMAWLLKGVDLLSIVLALAFLIPGGLLLSSLGVLLGVLPTNKAGRHSLSALFSLGLLVAWGFSWALWFEGLSEITSETLQTLSDEPGLFAIILGVILNGWVAALALCLVLSAALLTFRAGNRSTGPRLLWFGLFLNSLAWLVGGGFLVPLIETSAHSLDADNWAEALAGLVGAGAFWSLLLAGFACTENSELSPRQARWITEARGWRRATTWFLGPGSARGRAATLFAFALLGILGGIACWLNWVTSTSADRDVGEMLLFAWLEVCYLLPLVLAVDFATRRWFSRWCDSPGLRRACILPVAVGLFIILILPTAMLDADTLHAVNPITGPGMLAFREGKIELREAWMVLASIAGWISLIVLYVQMRRSWAIRTRRVRAQADDPNPRGG